METATSCWSKVLQSALSQGLISETAPRAFFYDLCYLEKTWKQLIATFPEGTLHTFALKACPVKGILTFAFEKGLGAECASIGEVWLAESFGCPVNKIVFDSPVKTVADLKYALEKGIYINIDNFQEMEKIGQLLQNDSLLSRDEARIGVRVNPQIGAGLIEETSTASAKSKFGIPLVDQRSEIIRSFEKYSFLQGIHVHVGSQGCTWELLEKGIRAGVDLALEIDKRVPGQLKTFDIGGGLSADYDGLSNGANFEEYMERLKRVAPELFQFRILTEFGRRLCAKAAVFVSQVVCTKTAGNRNIVLSYIGADNFLRPVYLPKNWKHRLLVFDRKGQSKQDKPDYSSIEQDIAGPLCFSGDIFAFGRALPRCEPGDWLVVLDSGAYTLSMYSRHTSQLVPPVYGFSQDRNKFMLLKKEETREQLVAFWS
eukprot:jgi/Galph1/4986/GphlegSOOS_G3633.1